MSYIRIANNGFTIEAIQAVDFAANTPEGHGVSITVEGFQDPFWFTGEYASYAYDQLTAKMICIGDDKFFPHQILWVDYAADVQGAVGIELALRGEFEENQVFVEGKFVQQNTPVTRKYTGSLAEELSVLLEDLEG